MKKPKDTKKRMLETAQEMAQGLYDAGVINSITLREYQALTLPLIKELTPKEIKKIRLHEKISQSVFAKILNTSLSTVRQWEQGGKHPRGTSLKLLNLVADKGIDCLL